MSPRQRSARAPATARTARTRGHHGGPTVRRSETSAYATPSATNASAAGHQRTMAAAAMSLASLRLLCVATPVALGRDDSAPEAAPADPRCLEKPGRVAHPPVGNAPSSMRKIAPPCKSTTYTSPAASSPNELILMG